MRRLHVASERMFVDYTGTNTWEECKPRTLPRYRRCNICASGLNQPLRRTSDPPETTWVGRGMVRRGGLRYHGLTRPRVGVLIVCVQQGIFHFRTFGTNARAVLNCHDV
jgi:hypothetical protein